MSILKIAVVFRYDDYSGVSPTQVEEQIIHVFREQGVSCVFGVIPCVCSGNQFSLTAQPEIPVPLGKIELLKTAIQDGVVEIALHGYTHQTVVRTDLRSPSEFAGDILFQRERLFRGKKFLQDALGISIHLFIPPWNAYDANTLHALGELNFSCLAAGLHSGLSLPDINLLYLPNTCGLTNIKQAISQARAYEQPVVIQVMLHPYEFQESKNKLAVYSLADLQDTLAWLVTQPDVYITSLQALCDSKTPLGADRYEQNLKLHRIHALLHPALRRYCRLPLVYLSQMDAKKIEIKLLMGLLWFYGIVLLSMSGAGFALAFYLPGFVSFMFIPVSLGVLLVLLLRAWRLWPIKYRTLFPLLAVFGFLGGCLIASIV